MDLPTHLRGIPQGAEQLSRADLSRHQRERIVSTVIPVFAKRGYQATTVDDLQSASHIGPGSLYSLFEGKEDCFLACLDHVAGEATETFETAVRSAEGWDARSYRGLEAVLGYFAAEPLGARVFLVEAQCAGRESTERYQAVLDRAVDWLSRGRLEHPDAAGLPPSFEQAAISGLAFYLQQCLLEARKHDAAELLSEIADLILGPIMGAERLAEVSAESVETAAS